MTHLEVSKPCFPRQSIAGLTEAYIEDRTGELRKLGFSGRRLGTEQMTTDTAARVTRLVIQGKSMSASRQVYAKIP